MKSLARCLRLATLWFLLSVAALVHAASSVAIDWDNAALQAIRNTKPGPPMVARALAIAHTGMFDAWTAYDPVAVGTRLGGTLRRPVAERTEANKQKAISFAAYRALVDLFPSEKAFFDGLMTSSGYNPNDTTTDTTSPSGIGNVVAKTLLDFRHQDGANQLGDRSSGGYSDYTGYRPVNTPDAINDPNRWQPLRLPNGSVQTFVAPHWQNVIPFALTSASQFRPGPPAQFGSAAYQTQAQEIVDLTANLTDRQKAIIEYWADGPASELPPGHWCLFTQAVSRRDSLTLDADVKLFFAVTNALFDASIVAWDAKRAYDSVRPITAVRFLFRNQFIQGINGQTVLGQEWRPYQPSTFPTPAFAEYTSGHSTFSAAAAEILKSSTGSDAFDHSVTVLAGSSRIELGVPAQDVTLSWATFSEAADEAGTSRRLGGIHFLDGDLRGRANGRQVGALAWTKATTYFDGTQTAPPPQPFPAPSPLPKPDPCDDDTFDHDQCMEQGGGCTLGRRGQIDSTWIGLLLAAVGYRLHSRRRTVASHRQNLNGLHGSSESQARAHPNANSWWRAKQSRSARQSQPGTTIKQRLKRRELC